MLLRIAGAAGAILLTASVTTASSVSAEEPEPTTKIIFDPGTGQIPILNGAAGTGAKISADTPCPATHESQFRLQLAKSDGSVVKNAIRTALPADKIPATAADFDIWSASQPTYPADGDVWYVKLFCHASVAVSIQVAQATIHVSGTQWTAESTAPEYHPELDLSIQAKAGEGTLFTLKGFKSGEQVAITARPEADGAATPVPVGTVTTTSTGGFEGQLTLPAEWATKVYRFIATGQQSAASVEATMPVTTAGFGVTLTPQNIKVGERTTAALTGFGAGEQVDVTAVEPGGSTVAQQTVTVDAQGAASQTLMVPAGAQTGRYTVTAVGKTSTVKFELPLGVSPATTTPPTSGPPTSGPPTSEPPTSEPPASDDPTDTGSPTATDTGSPTPTGTDSVGGAVGGDSGGSDSGGSDGGKGGGGLASTGAFFDPRFLGTLGAMVMAGSGAVWYRLRQRTPMLEAEVAD
ncbi:hypothetical protein LO772_27875 [Yinghuangia sp. ASG 101]|uniref:hypothetical protein n=1 Tax=Yinghuangia sp. ASG 101 TaxID=2896848 RepID=UPI001E5D6D23|nr:hypothetical protein [Yinghuangia sp. ASG 101]UGQ10624.1 hypothetical protein LO772_27875 [Yinghuangia sp. ASG 101]